MSPASKECNVIPGHDSRAVLKNCCNSIQGIMDVCRVSGLQLLLETADQFYEALLAQEDALRANDDVLEDNAAVPFARLVPALERAHRARVPKKGEGSIDPRTFLGISPPYEIEKISINHSNGVKHL